MLSLKIWFGIGVAEAGNVQKNERSPIWEREHPHLEGSKHSIEFMGIAIVEYCDEKLQLILGP